MNREDGYREYELIFACKNGERLETTRIAKKKKKKKIGYSDHSSSIGAEGGYCWRAEAVSSGYFCSRWVLIFLSVCSCELEWAARAKTSTSVSKRCYRGRFSSRVKAWYGSESACELLHIAPCWTHWTHQGSVARIIIWRLMAVSGVNVISFIEASFYHSSWFLQHPLNVFVVSQLEELASELLRQTHSVTTRVFHTLRPKKKASNVNSMNRHLVCSYFERRRCERIDNVIFLWELLFPPPTFTISPPRGKIKVISLATWNIYSDTPRDHTCSDFIGQGFLHVLKSVTSVPPSCLFLQYNGYHRVACCYERSSQRRALPQLFRTVWLCKSFWPRAGLRNCHSPQQKGQEWRVEERVALLWSWRWIPKPPPVDWRSQEKTVRDEED